MNRQTIKEQQLVLWWLFWFAIMALGAVFCFFHGYSAAVVRGDQTGISVFIACIFVILVALNCRNMIFIQRELNAAYGLREHLQSGRVNIGRIRIVLGIYNGVCSRYIQSIINISLRSGGKMPNQSNLAETAHTQLEIRERKIIYGMELLLALGFFGTLAGFIMMMGDGGLGSIISGGGNANISKAVEQALRGMGTAFYTTVVGLVAAMFLGILHLLVKNATTILVCVLVETTEKYIVPYGDQS